MLTDVDECLWEQTTKTPSGLILHSKSDFTKFSRQFEAVEPNNHNVLSATEEHVDRYVHQESVRKCD